MGHKSRVVITDRHDANGQRVYLWWHRWKDDGENGPGCALTVSDEEIADDWVRNLSRSIYIVVDERSGNHGRDARDPVTHGGGEMAGGKVAPPKYTTWINPDRDGAGDDEAGAIDVASRRLQNEALDAVHVYKYVGTVRKPTPKAEWIPDGGAPTVIGNGDAKKV